MRLSKIVITFILALTMVLSLASCEQIEAGIQNALNEANATIAELEAAKTELENAKATLETAKAELEAEKAELENAKTGLEGEKEALEKRIEGLLNCAMGEHDINITPNEDSTHTIICLYCELRKTEDCSLLDYVDNGDGSYTATCSTCGNTHTEDGSELFVVVRTEEELNHAVRTDGARIKLGADIDLLSYVTINCTVEIDIAGHRISTNDPSLNEFFVYDTLYIYDSVGGGSVENGFNTYSNSYLKIGSMDLDYNDPFGMNGTVNLSQYNGSEFISYIALFTDVILHEGYGFYSDSTGELLPDFEAAKAAGWVTIKPIES